MSLGEVIVVRVVFVLLAFWLLVELPAHAREVDKVSLPEQLDLGSQKLVLNGAGLRIKHRIGIDFHVYVAGLYLSRKSSSATDILASEEPKVLDLVFVRSLDADTLQDSWTEAYAKNCKINCEGTKANLAAFNALMVKVKDGQHLKLTFTKDGVDVGGVNTGHVAGGDFSRNMLAVFIGDSPPTPELKAHLLGSP